MNSYNYDKLVETIKKLRNPENGCPWDLKQTIQTLSPALLEESCECIDGAASNDYSNVAEELGDILFTSSLMAYILQQDGYITISEIIESVNNKMIRRHPHVFSNQQGIDTSEKVLEQWDFIKENLEGRKNNDILSKIPKSLPPLEKSFEIQKKVKKVGFDWSNINDIFEKIQEEIFEVKDEINNNNFDNLELEIGDLLFSVINLSRFLKVDPSIALNRTNNKFTKRFSFVEKEMNEKNIEMNSDNFQIMDDLWNESKKLEK